jgi:hypothetical protein
LVPVFAQYLEIGKADLISSYFIDFDKIAAGRLAEVYGLRGFDAVHLSAAELLRSSGNAPSVAFSSFDAKLNAAATAEKFKVLLPK